MFFYAHLLSYYFLYFLGAIILFFLVGTTALAFFYQLLKDIPDWVHFFCFFVLFCFGRASMWLPNTPTILKSKTCSGRRINTLLAPA